MQQHVKNVETDQNRILVFVRTILVPVEIVVSMDRVAKQEHFAVVRIQMCVVRMDIYVAVVVRVVHQTPLVAIAVME